MVNVASRKIRMNGDEAAGGVADQENYDSTPLPHLCYTGLLLRVPKRREEGRITNQRPHWRARR